MPKLNLILTRADLPERLRNKKFEEIKKTDFVANYHLFSSFEGVVFKDGEQEKKLK